MHLKLLLIQQPPPGEEPPVLPLRNAGSSAAWNHMLDRWTWRRGDGGS